MPKVLLDLEKPLGNNIIIYVCNVFSSQSLSQFVTSMVSKQKAKI